MKHFLIIVLFAVIFTNRCVAQTYKYDAADRLVQVSSNCAGTLYTYDANGNRLSTNEVSIVTISSVFDEKCGKDGQILILPQDTSAKYKYAWSNGQTTPRITNLSGGTYSVVITEPTTGFTCDQTFKIKGIFKDSVAITSYPVVCTGGNNGSAKIKIVSPDTIGTYLYHWSTSADTAYTRLDSVSNLKPGDYIALIRNTVRGCIKKINFTITEPPVIISGIIKNDASCPSINDGEVIVKVNGDSTNYKFDWTSPSFSGTIRGQHLTGLPTGKYMLVVTQNRTLCTETRSITIGALLTDAVITADGPTTFFVGKSVLLSANIGAGFSYQWNKNGTPISAIGPTYTASENGSFTVQITANRCTLTSLPTIVNTLPQNNFTISATDETCRTSNNGSIDVTAVTPLKYIATIKGDNISPIKYPFTTPLHIGNLSAGNYNVCITVDGQSAYNQCYDLVISEPQDLAVLNITVNNIMKTITLSLNGGSKYKLELNGYSYNTTETKVTLPILIGKNQLRITADNICQGVFEREFTLSDGIVVSPNPFERSLTISVGNQTTKRIDVQIYNAVGYLVYSSTLNNENGFITIPLPELLKGVYSLKLSISNQVYKISRK